MIFSYLSETNIFDRYKDSKTYTEQLTDPFPEWERIARNRPHGGIDKRYPKTTDGTTASIVRKTPKRVVQQLPTGVVETDDDDAWLPIVAGFIYTNKILPYANEEYDLIQKWWTALEKGLTFGACAIYSPFLNHDGYFCPDMTIPYWGDIFLQKGKKSGYDCSYVFMRSWWQKEDLEALIDREKKLAKSAKQRGEAYDSSWDLTALKSILKAEIKKDEQATTPSDRDRGVNTSGIELVTGFQKGVGATFLTFNPSEKVIVRRKTNKDPRGKIPIDWFYGDTDGSNPLGRGVVELVGGLQNLIDSDMQMYQYNRALLLAPPVMKWGTVSSKKVVFEPNALIDMGTDPSNKLEALNIDSTALAKYPELYGLQKSQLLNLVNSPDTSISSEVGNPGFGKTPEALTQNKATISVDDNFVRKSFEASFENWSETGINLYFAERTGIEELQLDDETAKKLRKLATETWSDGTPKFDLNQLSEDNKIRINYDTATPALKFRVDASTSKMKDDSDQLTALQGLLTTLESSPILTQIVPPEKIIGAWNAIVAASGVEDPEELSIDVEEFKKQQEMAAEQQMAMQAQPAPALEAQPMEQEQPVMEQPAEQQVDMPQGQMDQMPQDPQEQNDQFIRYLQYLGAPNEVIDTAQQAFDTGATVDEVAQAIGMTQGAQA